MTIENFLSRLNRLQHLPNGQWRASCPTALHRHGDRSAGLRIKEADDGRTLIYCHAGCSAELISAALGLTLADLFPQPERRPVSAQARSPSYISRDVATVLAYDAVTASIALDYAKQGLEFSAHDISQMEASAGRLYKFAQRIGGKA